MRTQVAPRGNSTLDLGLSFLLPLPVIEVAVLHTGRSLSDALGTLDLIKIGALGVLVLVGLLHVPQFG